MKRTVPAPERPAGLAVLKCYLWKFREDQLACEAEEQQQQRQLPAVVWMYAALIIVKT